MPERPDQPIDELRDVRYEDLLRAVGRYLDQHGYADVLVTKLPDGVLVKGTVTDRTAVIPREHVASVMFSSADVLQLVAESERLRASSGEG